VTLRYDRFIMKASVRLELQQAEVRSRLRLDRRQPSPETSSPESAGLRRAIAALGLAYGRGWSAADITHHFGWPRKRSSAGSRRANRY
jgi:hypothetical protein